jgi:hypothetical protein
MVEFCFESLQMDLRYLVRPRMHRLGNWINVYLFMWINAKSSVKHLFVFLKHSKQICFLVCIKMSETFHDLSYICIFIPCVQNLGPKAFQLIFAKELVFKLDVKQVFHGIEFF